MFLITFDFHISIFYLENKTKHKTTTLFKVSFLSNMKNEDAKSTKQYERVIQGLELKKRERENNKNKNK